MERWRVAPPPPSLSLFVRKFVPCEGRASVRCCAHASTSASANAMRQSLRRVTLRPIGRAATAPRCRCASRRRRARSCVGWRGIVCDAFRAERDTGTLSPVPLAGNDAVRTAFQRAERGGQFRRQSLRPLPRCPVREPTSLPCRSFARSTPRDRSIRPADPRASEPCLRSIDRRAAG
jgi:hypothetical protein